MRITFADGYSSSVNALHHRGEGLFSRRRERSALMRERRAEREMQLQEAENKRIAQISKRMERIQNREVDPAYSHEDQQKIREQRANMLEMLAKQIARIHEVRADRLNAHAEFDAREMQAQLEENIREREERAEEMAERQPDRPQPREEADQAHARDLISNFARHDINREVMHGLAQVRAARSAEATLLRQAQEAINGQSPFLYKTRVDGVPITGVAPRAAVAPTDFISTHLRALDEGIARLDETMMQRVITMYRQSVQDGEDLKNEALYNEETPQP